MEGILKVDPQKLINTANEFNSTGSQIKGLTQNMMDTVNGLKSVWQGDAATSYQTKFNSLQAAMEKMDRMIREHVTDLNEMARQYQLAESTSTEKATSLPSSVI